MYVGMHVGREGGREAGKSVAHDIATFSFQEGPAVLTVNITGR